MAFRRGLRRGLDRSVGSAIDYFGSLRSGNVA